MGPLEINITGRVMMLCRRCGFADMGRVSTYANAVIAVVRSQLDSKRPSLIEIEPILSEQLVLLEASLLAAKAGVGANDEANMVLPDKVEEELVEEKVVAEEVPKKKRPKKYRTNVVEAPLAMEAKLQNERQPVKKLLTEDCVRFNLLEEKRANQLVASMVGRTKEEAEIRIVEELRQSLQNQVKTYMRKNSGGPWGSVAAQEEIRQDIHHTRSVQGIIMLVKQITKETKAWDNEHGGGGFLSMLGLRKSGFGQ